MRKIDEFGLYLQDRAHWTQRIIYKGMISRLGIMEETLTDMHLISISDEFGDFVYTKKFNRREEGMESGADWLWLIGEPGSWLPLLVQAKIVNPKTQNCFHLDYKNGEQRVKLVNFARKNAFVPIYCIYSFIPNALELRDRKLDIKTYAEDWACSFISPKSVRDLSRFNIKSQKEILKHSIPWMDPFIMALGRKEPFGESVAKSFQDNRDNIKNYHLSTKTSELSVDNHFMSFKNSIYENGKQISNSLPKKNRNSWEQLDTLQTLRKDIPRNIVKWFSDTNDENSNIPISGASIISTVPINQITELKK